MSPARINIAAAARARVGICLAKRRERERERERESNSIALGILAFQTSYIRREIIKYARRTEPTAHKQRVA